MKFKTMIGAAVIVAAGTFSAQAATIGFQGPGPITGAGTVLPGTFNLTATTGLAIGTSLDAAVSGALGGFLSSDRVVSDAPALKYTFLGAEAGFTNFALANGSVIFTKGDAVGSTTTVLHPGGPIDFVYETDNGSGGGSGSAGNDSISNLTNSATKASLNIGVYLESATSAILLFGDGIGDVDFDDLAVRVQVIPLPAGLLLLLSGLGGLALVGRRRMTAA